MDAIFWSTGVTSGNSSLCIRGSCFSRSASGKGIFRLPAITSETCVPPVGSS